MDARLGADDAHFGIDIQSETYQKAAVTSCVLRGYFKNREQYFFRDQQTEDAKDTISANGNGIRWEKKIDANFKLAIRGFKQQIVAED